MGTSAGVDRTSASPAGDAPFTLAEPPPRMLGLRDTSACGATSASAGAVALSDRWTR